jgi:hypothetical protein
VGPDVVVEMVVVEADVVVDVEQVVYLMSNHGHSIHRSWLALN